MAASRARGRWNGRCAGRSGGSPWWPVGVPGGVERGPMIRRSPRRTCRTPFGKDRVPQAVHPVAVGDGAAGQVDGADRESVGRPFGEVRADQRRLRGHGVAPRVEHQRSHWLHAKSYTVRVDSACAAVIASLIRTASSTVRPAGRSGGRVADVRLGSPRTCPEPEQHRRHRAHRGGGVAPASGPLRWPALTRAAEKGAAHVRAALALPVVSMKGAVSGPGSIPVAHGRRPPPRDP